MKTKYLYILIIIPFYTLISTAQETGFPLIHNYTPKEYNNAPQIFSTIQDNNGIMYFGGDDVIEYDGVSWRTISKEKQINTYDLAKDKDGRIYVAAIDEFGFLTYDLKGTCIYKSLTYLLRDTSLKLGTVWSIKLTSQFVYFRTYDAILQYAPSAENLSIFKADTNGVFTCDFVFDDTYYIKLSKKDLMKIENNELIPAPQSVYLKNINLFSALPFNDTSLLILTRTNGLYLYQPNNHTIPQKFIVSKEDFFVDNDIYNISLFQKEKFILGSFKQGALLVDKNGTTLQQYSESNLLQNNYVYCANQDTSQNIWLGLANGISKTEHSQDLSYWNKNSGIDNIVENVIRYKGTIYIATFTKIYFIDKDKQVQEVKNIPIGVTWCLSEIKSFNKLLAGTQDGIYEIIGDKAIQIYTGSHAPVIYQSVKNPSRILSTDNEFLISLKYENNKWIFEGKWEGIKDDLRGILEDEKGEIWLGTYSNGVIRVTPDDKNITKPKKVRYYNKKDGFTSLKNILPFKVKNKIIWGTESGLYIFNSQTDHFEPFCELGEQFCNGSRGVYSVKEMPDGKIWICPLENQKADIGYLQPNNKGGYDWVYAPFRRIPAMFLEAFYIEPSGIAWIGGSEGLYRYDMNKDTKNYTQHYNCLIRKISYGPDSLLFGGNNSKISLTGLEYQYNSLKFEFAAPFFDQEEKTRYSYKLEGYNKEWSKWSRQTQKDYTNLSEGTYTFKVKALNVYDVESEISTYQITIFPPFYRTWWAYFMYVLLSGLMVFGIVKLNLIRLQKDKEHLEGIIKQRTSEVVQQKEEILAQKNELEIANATKIKFFSIIAHDLRNPFNNLINFSDILIEHIMEKDFEKVSEFAAIIHQSSSVAYDLLENLLNWSKSQTGKISFAPENLDLKALIDTNILLLNNSAESKGIHLSSTLDKSINIYADKNMLLSIIRNLITNAIKFSRKDDRITVEVEESEDNITLKVSDTGVGIEREIIDDLFKVDKNIKTKGTAKEPGTGLGLILCKEFIDWHKGKIWVESEVGKGSIFSFTLPLTKKNI